MPSTTTELFCKQWVIGWTRPMYRLHYKIMNDQMSSTLIQGNCVSGLNQMNSPFPDRLEKIKDLEKSTICNVLMTNWNGKWWDKRFIDSLLVEGYLWKKKSEDIESGKEKNLEQKRWTAYTETVICHWTTTRKQIVTFLWFYGSSFIRHSKFECNFTREISKMAPCTQLLHFIAVAP